MRPTTLGACTTGQALREMAGRSISMQSMGARTALLGAVLLAGLGSAAGADATAGLSEQFLQCRDMARGAVEQGACLSGEAQRQDARLNQVYRRLHARLQGEHRGRLVTSQRAWFASRERDEALESALNVAGQAGSLQGDRDGPLRVASRADRLHIWLAPLD